MIISRHSLSVFLAVMVIFVLTNGVFAQDIPPLNVVATTGMIGDAVENIGGERVSASTLMGPGVDPHLYRASEGDVRRIAQADLVFFNGLHLEARMADVLARMEGRVTTVAVGEAVSPELLLDDEDYPGQPDPHIWFDVELWMKAVEKVRDTLIEHDSDHAGYYRENTGTYLAQLSELHQYVIDQAERVPENQRVLITAHDAFGYFGQAYGFEVRGLQGISTEAEAGIRDVRELADFIVEKHIPAVFIESSVPVRNIEAVREAVRAQGFEASIGGELFSDALGDAGTFEGTYIGMVTHNIDTIVGALLQEGE